MSQAYARKVFYPLILICFYFWHTGLLICVQKRGPSQPMLAQLKNSTGLCFVFLFFVFCFFFVYSRSQQDPKDKYFSLCGL